MNAQSIPFPAIGDKADSWVDLHNPNGVTCDDNSAACTLESSTGANVDVTQARSNSQALQLKLEDAGNKCVKMKKDRKIEDEGCEKAKNVLCQSECEGKLTTDGKNLDIASQPCLFQPATCSAKGTDTFTVNGRKHLLLPSEARSHPNIGAFCTDKGLQLAKIRSSQDLQDIRTFLSRLHELSE